MKVVDEYAGDDGLSILDNNSYALCVRYIDARKIWSKHACGTAIDINPVQNTYVEAHGMQDDLARFHIEPLCLPGTQRLNPYIDRGINMPGIIIAESEIYKIFKIYGWECGG